MPPCLQVKEYELSEVFRHSEDSQHFDVFRAEPAAPHPNSIPVMGADGAEGVQQEIEEQRLEEERRLQQHQQELTTLG